AFGGAVRRNVGGSGCRRDELRESSIHGTTPLRPRGTRPSEAMLGEGRTALHTSGMHVHSLK
ncbi:MAG: hypothetical protein KF833_18985, partial [Verrucomicrobiae bacterium]|nr:hypothetical protein [Verrucomicrobiae bacterium]